MFGQPLPNSIYRHLYDIILIGLDLIPSPKRQFKVANKLSVKYDLLEQQQLLSL